MAHLKELVKELKYNNKRFLKEDSFLCWALSRLTLSLCRLLSSPYFDSLSPTRMLEQFLLGKSSRPALDLYLRNNSSKVDTFYFSIKTRLSPKFQFRTLLQVEKSSFYLHYRTTQQATVIRQNQKHAEEVRRARLHTFPKFQRHTPSRTREIELFPCTLLQYTASYSNPTKSKTRGRRPPTSITYFSKVSASYPF